MQGSAGAHQTRVQKNFRVSSQKRRGHCTLKEFGVMCLNQPVVTTPGTTTPFGNVRTVWGFMLRCNPSLHFRTEFRRKETKKKKRIHLSTSALPIHMIATWHTPIHWLGWGTRKNENTKRRGALAPPPRRPTEPNEHCFKSPFQTAWRTCISQVLQLSVQHQ